MKRLFLLLTMIFLMVISPLTWAKEPVKSKDTAQAEYTVGIDDVLEIAILQPEKLLTTVTVSPDGSITFPYIGNVQVKGMTLEKVQEEIQKRLANGYMKYPVVSVSLRECRSRKFSVSGDVFRPGMYSIVEGTTVLEAISIAGGFAGYGPASQVKVLRPKKDKGYISIQVNIEAAINGDSTQNFFIQPGDIIEVTKGTFSVYGEVIKPGTYPIEENTTVLKAISIAGGFTKYGSAARVKILRPKTDSSGYNTIKINIKHIMKGSSKEDILLKPGDIIVVNEGIF